MEEKIKIPTKVIVKWSLIALVIVLLILSIFAQKIFGTDSKFAEVIQLNMGDIANVFGLIGDNIPKILQALTYIVVIIYSYVIKEFDNIFLSSLVPVIGFTLSTLSLKLVRKIWENKNK